MAAVSAAVSSVGASPASQVPNTGPAHLQSPFDHIGALTSSSAFAIGDAVDGKCETNNGSYRWFPGVVLCLHEDGTVDVEYSDGDKHLHKSMDGIRPTRRRSDENTMQPQPAPITSTAVTAPHPVAVTSSSLIHQADSNVSNDYVSVMSSGKHVNLNTTSLLMLINPSQIQSLRADRKKATMFSKFLQRWNPMPTRGHL